MKHATDDELKGAIADKYTAVTTAGRRLNGRRLPTVGVSADQSTEISSVDTGTIDFCDYNGCA